MQSDMTIFSLSLFLSFLKGEITFRLRKTPLTLPPCEVEVVVVEVLIVVELWLELLEPALPRCTTW